MSRQMRHSSNVQTETPSRCIPFHRQTKTSKRSKPIHHPQSEMPFILTSMQSVRVLIKAVLSSPSSSFRPFQSKDKQTKATPYPTLIVELAVYVVGLGFIFRLPPVRVTFTKRRVYVILFFARPLGVFFFSCGSTFGV